MTEERQCPADPAAAKRWLGGHDTEPEYPIKVVTGVENCVVSFSYKPSRRDAAESYVRQYGGHVVDLRGGATQSCPCTESRPTKRGKGKG